MVKKCSVEDCEKGGQLRRGWCNMHYRRWRTHGDHSTLGYVRGPAHPDWSDEISYKGAHHRVRRSRGSAVEHSCVCGDPAEEWAYDHLDGNELTGAVRGCVLTYSTDPDRYIPLCRSCHKKFDIEFANSQKEVLF